MRPLIATVCLREHARGQRVPIMETRTADLLQRTQMKSDHACNMKTWECFPAAAPDFEPDTSERSFGLSHPPVFVFHSGGCALIQKTRSHFFLYRLHLQSQKVNIMHAVM